MRDRDLTHLAGANPDLGERAARWRQDHPDATLEDAVRDLRLWEVPQDPDAQRLIWAALKASGDPAALGGFAAMRSAASRRGRTP